MKTETTKTLSQRTLAIAISLTIFAAPVFAQGVNAPVKTNTKILYHDGPVMRDASDVYLIWYGNWYGNYAQSVVTDLMINIGGTPYFNINTAYTDAVGRGPNGYLFYCGSIQDSYSHGAQLSVLDIQGIIGDQIRSGALPLDGNGIYIVLASADISSPSTGFCSLGAPPHHGTLLFNGATVKYAFLGDPARCPSTAAPYLPFPGPTPNGSFSGDGMANALAAVLSATVTNPTGSGWFDRYGLENSTKCQGVFGPTYPAANGAPANIHIGNRDYLIQQNWVNSTRKGYCALAAPVP
jgi:hypothetical protein